MSSEEKMMELCKNLAIELIPKGITAVGTAHGFPIPPEVTRIVLKSFIGLLEEQKKIDSRLDKLIGSYYKDGIDNLTDSRLAVNPEERKRLITTAINNFRTAKNVEGTLLIIKSEFYIGTCYDLLGEINLAQSHHEKAYTLAYQQAMQLTRKGRVETTSWLTRSPKLVEMDEATRIKWWNMFKNLKSDDMVSKSDELLFGRGFEWARDNPKEAMAMMQYQMNKMRTSTFFIEVWGYLNNQEQDEILELRDFSNSLELVLRAYGSTIVL
jgi:hypothetical protein